MRVFLTGATGYIGSAVAEKLISEGHHVTGLARSEEKAQTLRDRRVEPYLGDLNEPQGIVDAARQAEGVIHTASTGGQGAAQADRQTVEAILTALKGSGKPFIYTSGVWVLGNTGNNMADENSPLDPTPLVSWRPAVEQMVLNAVSSQIRAVIIRPVVVYGRGGGIIGGMVRSAQRGGVVRYVGTGENRWSLVHVEDLAELYLLALDGAPAGTVLMAASGTPVKVREIAKAIAEAAGIRGGAQSWPLEEARQQLGPYADALALDQQVSGERATRLLGWKPRSPSLIEELFNAPQ